MTPKDRKASANCGGFSYAQYAGTLVAEPLGSGCRLRVVQSNRHITPSVLKTMKLGRHRALQHPKLQRHPAVAGFGARLPDDSVERSMTGYFQDCAIGFQIFHGKRLVGVGKKQHGVWKTRSACDLHDVRAIASVRTYGRELCFLQRAQIERTAKDPPERVIGCVIPGQASKQGSREHYNNQHPSAPSNGTSGLWGFRLSLRACSRVHG